jgi:hypothetical protein
MFPALVINELVLRHVLLRNPHLSLSRTTLAAQHKFRLTGIRAWHVILALDVVETDFTGEILDGAKVRVLESPDAAALRVNRACPVVLLQICIHLREGYYAVLGAGLYRTFYLDVDVAGEDAAFFALDASQLSIVVGLNCLSRYDRVVETALVCQREP